MRPGVPWSVKGIDDDARQAAKSAARKAGLTLGQWLNTMILETADDPDSLPPEFAPPPRADRQSEAAAAPAETSEPAGATHDARADDEVIRNKLDKLADQLSSLAQQSQDTAVSRFMPPEEEPAADTGTLEAIIDRIEANERRADASMDEVNTRLQQIAVQLAEQPTLAFPERPEDVPGFSALETALRSIADHIEVSETRTVETLTMLQERMAEIANRAFQAQDEGINSSAPAIASLEQRVSELADRLEQSKHDSAQNLRSYVDSSVEQLSQRIDAVRHSTDAVAEQAKTIATHSAQQQAHQIEERLSNVIEGIQASVPEAPDISPLKSEIDSLNQRFDDIKAESASDRDVQALQSAIKQLTSQIDAGPDLTPISDFEKRLAGLTQRIEQMPGIDVVSPQIGELEKRVEDLDTQLQQAITTQQSGADTDALANQIASVSERLTATEQKLGHIETIERSIAQLFDSIEQNRVWAKEVAEEAANRVMQQIPPANNIDPNQFAPSEELQALKDGLGAVKASAELADQRNQETLEAVHDTLEQIINKLTELEQTATSAASNVAPQFVEQLQEAHQMVGAAAMNVGGHQQTQTVSSEPQLEELFVAGAEQPQDTAQPSAPDAGLDPDFITPPGEMASPTLPPSGAQMPPELPSGAASVQPADNLSPMSPAGDGPTIAPAPAANAAAPFPPNVNLPPPAEAPDLGREDFIAAARQAAQTASAKSILGSLSRPAAADGYPANDMDADVPQKRSRFSLPFLGRKRSNDPADYDVNATLAEEDAGNVNGKRRQLILAGLVLLAAVSAYNFGGIGKKSVAPKAVPTETAPMQKTDDLIPELQSLLAPEPASRQQASMDTVIEKQSEPSATTGMTATSVEEQPTVDEAVAGSSHKTMPANIEVTTASVTAPVATAVTSRSNAIIALDPPPALTPGAPAATSPAPMQTASSASTTSTIAPPPQLTAPVLPKTVELPEEIGSESLRKAAFNGEPNAQFVIASRFLDGKMVKQDFHKAADWYRKAAAQGLAPAQYRLGTMFERGRGLPKDLIAARLWYERAAERKNVKSMHNLAVVYSNNQDGTAQFDKAAKWFRAAAEHGLRDSLYNLAVLYERGLGITQDMAQAYFWYGIAARHKDADASAKLENIKRQVKASVREQLDNKIATWAPKKPDSAGNLVAITDSSWNVAGAVAKQPAPVPQSEPVQFSNVNLIRQAQVMLAGMGFDVGPQDGIMGARTSNAVRLFQLQTGMAVNGTVTPELVKMLEARTNSAAAL